MPGNLDRRPGADRRDARGVDALDHNVDAVAGAVVLGKPNALRYREGVVLNRLEIARGGRLQREARRIGVRVERTGDGNLDGNARYRQRDILGPDIERARWEAGAAHENRRREHDRSSGSASRSLG